MAEATGLGVEELGLFTDLYQLTMAQSYFAQQRNQPATFSLFIRTYPQHHTYFVAAGVATVLEYLAQVHFPPSALVYLQATGRFSTDFLAYLATWRFQGEVMALPEGSVFFIDKPVVEVTAPIIDAQLVAALTSMSWRRPSRTGPVLTCCVRTKIGVAADAPYYDHGLQAGAKRRPPGDEIERWQSYPGRGQAGLASHGRWAVRRRYHCPAA